MRAMSIVYLQAQFEELHEWAREHRGDRRVRVTLDYFYVSEISLYAAVHNLTVVREDLEEVMPSGAS